MAIGELTKPAASSKRIKEASMNAADLAKEVMEERGAPKNICEAAEAVSVGLVCGHERAKNLR